MIPKRKTQLSACELSNHKIWREIGLSAVAFRTTGGGDLNLRKLKGRAELTTGGGEIEVTDADLEGHVPASDEEVKLSNVREASASSSGSGPVIRSGEQSDAVPNTLGNAGHELPERSTTSDSVTTYMDDVSGQAPFAGANGVQIQKAGGDVELEDAPHGAKIRTGGGSIRVGAASDFVDATTGGGGIVIGPVSGIRPCQYGSGYVQVTLIDPAGHEQTVEIFTGSGDVEVVLPATLDAKFEIETAYTRKNAPAHIDSTWESRPSAGHRLGYTRGTARRYVRATGRAGSGRGLVRIKAVNGNVTLRRGR